MSDPYKILVVDDEPEICGLFELFFKRKKMTVSLAENGDEAFEVMKSTPIHAVLTDIRMPGTLSGVDLVKIIHKTLADPPIMFLMTGYAGTSTKELEECGVQFVFYKPFSVTEVGKMVVSEMDQKFGRSNLRQSPRFLKSIPIEILTEGFANALTTANIGHGGIFVNMQEALDINSHLEIQIVIGDKTFKTVVQVVWNRMTKDELRGNGMKFVSLSGELNEAIKGLLK